MSDLAAALPPVRGRLRTQVPLAPRTWLRVGGPAEAVFQPADLADLTAYLDADRRLLDLYADPQAWARKAILNIAGSGKFSSDRTIAQYAAEIWNVAPCPVE